MKNVEVYMRLVNKYSGSGCVGFQGPRKNAKKRTEV
jgi:hypothetical protein